jgi:hypothetical protein
MRAAVDLGAHSAVALPAWWRLPHRPRNVEALWLGRAAFSSREFRKAAIGGMTHSLPHHEEETRWALSARLQ